MNTSEIKTIKIKLLKATTIEQEVSALNSWDEIKTAISNTLTSDASNEIYYTNLDVYKGVDILNNIKEEFNATIRDGVRNGCYGSSTGEIHEGYTLYLPLELAQEYFNYEYVQYNVNPLHEILDNGGELLDYTEDQIDAFLDMSEDSGIKISHDNTYNYENEGCYLTCDLDFKLVGELDDDNNGMLIVRFHCGGDPRGNYTRWYAFKFDNQYDIMNVISPYREVSQEVEDHCHLINCNPADKDLLIKELEDLL